MSHLVTLRQGTDPGLVYLCTPPDMATTMGGFGPARYVGSTPPVPGASYVISADDLPRFRLYCHSHHATIVDARTTSPGQRPYGREAPLPECARCGQPARRGAQPQHCPNCGAPWDAIEIGAPYSRTPNGPGITCADCQSTTPAGFAHCIHCGTAHG
jgi:hypothetical protein